MRNDLPEVILLVCAAALAGCTTEIDVHESPSNERSLLIGSWEWETGVSHLEVDENLEAVQSGAFDNDGASPSEYEMLPNSESDLVLEGWMANAACDGGVPCDEGRVYQRHRMTYHVDADHFFPFALLRIEGTPGVIGGAGAGVFEGFGVSETRLGEDLAPHPSGEPAFEVAERRWRLVIDPEGTWHSTAHDRVPEENVASETEAASGVWELSADGTLTLHHDDGTVKSTVWKGDAIALDGLIFSRR